MKQTIKLRYQIKTIESKEIEIDFPIYRRHDLDTSTIFTKRISPTETIDVHERLDGTIEIEVSANDDMRRDSSDLNYHLGTGDHASSCNEFEEAFAKAKALLARFS